MKGLKMDNKTGLETLRELAGDVDEYARLYYSIKNDCEKKWGAVPRGITLRDKLKEIADKIESDMAEITKPQLPDGIEWPRFEDGELVAFGSRVCGLSEGCEKFIFTSSQGGVCQLQDADGFMVDVLSGERVKRPEVLAADGLPIKVGEMVYGLYSGESGIVASITRINNLTNLTKVTYESGEWDIAKKVTHTPPDTQERIADDSTMSPAEYCKKYGIVLPGEVCPQYMLADCVEPMVADLLRRQRELLANGGV